MKQIGVKMWSQNMKWVLLLYLVDPLNKHATWSDSTGLDDVIRDLKDTVISPIKKKHLFENSRLLQPQKMLLMGLQAVETLIAKATAKEAGRFINLHPSTLTDKWYRRISGNLMLLFSPCHKTTAFHHLYRWIDSFRTGSSSDHEATAMMKAQFMSLWDGLDTDHSCQKS